MAEETVERLARMRRAMGRMLREGRTKEFEALAAAYASLKAEHVVRVHEEQRAAARARRAQQRAVTVQEGPKPWRLPRGFGTSPLAQQRAREGWRPRVEPTAPASAGPWRGGWHPASERVWRPPS